MSYIRESIAFLCSCCLQAEVSCWNCGSKSSYDMRKWTEQLNREPLPWWSDNTDHCVHCGVEYRPRLEAWHDPDTGMFSQERPVDLSERARLEDIYRKSK